MPSTISLIQEIDQLIIHGINYLDRDILLPKLNFQWQATGGVVFAANIFHNDLAQLYIIWHLGNKFLAKLKVINLVYSNYT